MRIFFTALIGIIWQVIIVAQQPIDFEHITSSDGLAHNSLQNILQDSRGFIWIATENGLNRYDGHSFVEYKPNNIDTTSISGIFIWDIKEDAHGNIWVATNNAGLNKFDFEKETFIHYKHEPNDSNSLSKDYIRTILVDGKFVWIGTYGGGLNKLEVESGQIKRYNFDKLKCNALISKNITYLYKDHSGTIWVGTEGGLLKYKNNEDSFDIYCHNTKDNSTLSHNQVNAIIEDSKGVLWVGTKEGLNKFDKRTG